MDGLDIEEIAISKLENSFTFGAEYYGKEYVKAANIVRSLKYKTLQQVSNTITDGDHGAAEYQDKGILYLLSESVQEGYIDMSKCRYISEKKNKELKRSELHPFDVVVTKTGVYYGKSAVIPQSIDKANMIAHVGKIELKKAYNPYYVSMFFNCKYGYSQLRRRGIKATRPEIKLVEFPEIMIPVFSYGFEQAIENAVILANELIIKSDKVLVNCQKQLTDIIGFESKKDSSSCTIKQIASSFIKTGRLDAEYYQPKYDELFDALARFDCKPLGGDKGIVKTKKSIEPGSEAYQQEGIPFVRVSDVSKYEITKPAVFLSHSVVDNIESLYPAKDTILFSKDGSVGIAYKVEKDSQFVTSGALLHLTVRDTKEVLPDYLTLVLNSPIVQLQAERDSSGAIIQHWKPSEIEQVVIPVLDMPIQETIAAKVQESFALRRKSKELLEYAKQAVEMAIEQGEEAALEWLNDRVNV
jgi:restriction endonuclease S subunit